MKHLTSLYDLNPSDLFAILTRAADLKAMFRKGERPPLLQGRVLAQLFEKPSLRTRNSFEAAMIHLGGSGIFLTTAEAGLNGRESLQDIAKVLSSFSDVITMRTFPDITGFFIEHLDGFHTAIFLTSIRDFNYAGLRSDNGEIVGCQMYLPMPGHSATTADFFTPLSRNVENMFLQGTTSYPIERTLLTSGMVIGGVESLFTGGKPFVTNDMAIRYKAPAQSMFWHE